VGKKKIINPQSK